jgi:hypothetical protein
MARRATAAAAAAGGSKPPAPADRLSPDAAVALVRGLEESLWHSGRASADRALEGRLAPDVTLSGGYWDGRKVAGLDAARRCFDEWREAFPTAHLRVHAALGAPYGHGPRPDRWGVTVALRWSLLLVHQVRTVRRGR